MEKMPEREAGGYEVSQDLLSYVDQIMSRSAARGSEQAQAFAKLLSDLEKANSREEVLIAITDAKAAKILSSSEFIELLKLAQ